MYNSKAAIKSVGIVSLSVSIVVALLGLFGVDVSQEVTGLPEKIAGAIDQIILIVGMVLGIYGRKRATTTISGVFKAKD